MTWKTILKEDLIEQVIEALIPMYGSRAEVLGSNIMGVMYDENLKDAPPYTKEDVRSLIKDIEFAANANEDEDYIKIKESLDRLERLI
tara:strand:- start:357 stop:620 length:264 start_codon:yes stop_codon:yes gene_type:complete